MNPLTDAHYRQLFKHLSLNDLMNCRLVSKRFRDLVDEVRIKKLIIFKSLPPRPGKFQLLDEWYSLADCVHVLSVDKFFASKTIRRCLEKLEKLAIYTWQFSDKNFFKVRFVELTYLEVDCATIIHPAVLESPKLERIFFYQAWMNDSRKNVPNGHWLISVHDFGFEHVFSKQLKHINIRNIAEPPFFEYCVRRGLFNELEVIEMQLFDFESLLYIARNCPKLKKIDAGLGVSMQSEEVVSVKEVFSDCFTDQQLRTAANQLKLLANKDLDVYIWSLPFNVNTCERVRRFFSEMGNAVGVRQAWLALRITTDREYQLLREFDRDHFLDTFWRNVNILETRNVVDEARVYERLNNCATITTSINGDPAIAKDGIRSMPLQLRDFCLMSGYKTQCGNDVLDLLPKHVKYVYGLTLECYGPISFDFLFGMVGLKFVRLFLVHPMPPSVYLELIRTRKYLAYFEVYCERMENQSKEELSAFKAQVIKCLDKELGYKDAVFKIDVLSDHMLKLVRYVMKRNEHSFQLDGVCPIDAEPHFYRKVFGAVAHSKGIPVMEVKL